MNNHDEHEQNCKQLLSEGGTPNQADPHCLVNQNKLTNRHWGLGVPPSVMAILKTNKNQKVFVRYFALFIEEESMEHRP